MRSGSRGIGIAAAVVLLSASFLAARSVGSSYDEGYRRGIEGAELSRGGIFYRLGHRRGAQERAATFRVLAPGVTPGPSDRGMRPR